MSNQPDFLILLNDLARQMRLNADRRAAAHGMTRAQWVILFRLQRQAGLSQKELAEILEVEPISVGRMIDRLEARGMVERRPDPKDRRIWRLHLCPPAMPILEQMNAEREDMREMVTAGVAPDELRRIMEGLCRMKANVVADLRKQTQDIDDGLPAVAGAA